jgi:hypothetical protein
MFIQVEINAGLKKGDASFKPCTFKELTLKEGHLEDFVRMNVGLFFTDDDTGEPTENILIVGQQVSNTEKGRTDLIGIDGDANLILVELKRDEDDAKQRSEPFENQAIRYAASLATIETIEALIENIYIPYIEKHKGEKEFAGYQNLTTKEIANRKLVDEFLKQNKATTKFNLKQKIVLVASGFEKQTLSAVSWLIANGVEISCFKITPGKLLDKYFVKIDKVLPPPTLKKKLVGFKPGKASLTESHSLGSKQTKEQLPRMPYLFEKGVLKKGDILVIRGSDDSEAEVVNSSEVVFKGETLSYNEWGQTVKKWPSINIYDFAILKGGTKTLGELRFQKMYEEPDLPDSD